jgi:hypothetical protein
MSEDCTSREEFVVRSTDDGSTGTGTGGSWAFAPLDFRCASFVLDVALVFTSELSVEKLKETLSQLLCSYPTLCGRADENGTAISLCNEGVPFIVIDKRASGISVHSLLADEPRGKWTPMQPLQESAAMLSVQVTYLHDGCVLGVCASHRCLDGNAFYSFLKNWAALCRDDSLAFQSPLLDQDLAPNATLDRSNEEVIEDAVKAGWMKWPPDWFSNWTEALRSGRMTRRLGPIRFSAAALARIKGLAMRPDPSSCNDPGAAFVTTHEAVCAHLAQVSASVLGWESGFPLCVCTMVDVRGRVSHLPSNFMGNALTMGAARVPAGDALVSTAAALHEAWQPYSTRPSPLCTQQVHQYAENYLHKTGFEEIDIMNALVDKPYTVLANNFVKFPIYEDFGCGPPMFVIPHHSFCDTILLFPSPPEQEEEQRPASSDGIGMDVYFQCGLADAWLALPDDHAAWGQLLAHHDSDPADSITALLQLRAESFSHRDRINSLKPVSSPFYSKVVDFFGGCTIS